MYKFYGDWQTSLARKIVVDQSFFFLNFRYKFLISQTTKQLNLLQLCFLLAIASLKHKKSSCLAANLRTFILLDCLPDWLWLGLGLGPMTRHTVICLCHAGNKKKALARALDARGELYGKLVVIHFEAKFYHR